jgi:transcriptional regulator with XRE-family HTH domain
MVWLLVSCTRPRALAAPLGGLPGQDFPARGFCLLGLIGEFLDAEELRDFREPQVFRKEIVVAKEREKIGTRIRELREARNLTQAKLAEIIGVSPGQVSRWENNVEKPQTHNRTALEDYFGQGLSSWGSKGGAGRGQKNIADTNLQADRADELISFYSNEKPVEIHLCNTWIKLPFACAIKPRGRGLCDEQNIQITISTQEPYKIPSELSKFSDPVAIDALEAGHFDGIVFRLEEIKSAGEGQFLTLRRASYFDALGTNFNMDSSTGNSVRSLRQFLHGRTRRLHTGFKGDPLVNHLGVVIMVETIDGYLVVQERSGEVANRAQSLSSSISGSIKEKHFAKIGSGASLALSDIAIIAAEHGVEELAINIEELYFLGLFREFLRGGKPELYFFARTRLKLSQVQSRLRHAEHRRESKSISGLAFRNLDKSSAVGLSDGDSLDFRVALALQRIQETGNMTVIAGLLLSADHLKRARIQGVSV